MWQPVPGKLFASGIISNLAAFREQLFSLGVGKEWSGNRVIGCASKWNPKSQANLKAQNGNPRWWSCWRGVEMDFASSLIEQDSETSSEWLFTVIICGICEICGCDVSGWVGKRASRWGKSQISMLKFQCSNRTPRHLRHPWWLVATECRKGGSVCHWILLYEKLAPEFIRVTRDYARNGLRFNGLNHFFKGVGLWTRTHHNELWC